MIDQKNGWGMELELSRLDPRQRRDLEIVMVRARAGDEKACALLISCYEPGLRKTAGGVLGRMLRSEVDTEDLIQSVHGELWAGLRDGRYEVETVGRLLALARAILRAKVARLWKRLERREEVESRWGAGAGRPGRLAANADPANNPVNRIAADDQFERLCEEMTPTERRLIELRLLGYTTAEAAREMGRDSKNLRVTLNRLRKRLLRSGILSDRTSDSSSTQRHSILGGSESP